MWEFVQRIIEMRNQLFHHERF